MRAQLESIAIQVHANWRIHASDDGSPDGTRDILADFQRRVGRRMDVRNGPGRGYVANFLGLACAEEIDSDYFAFCDQDDVWEPDKLSRALAWLARVDQGVPALYCGRTRLIDAHDRDVGLSPLFSRAPHFGNAIVQSLAGGNTMVFNAAARELLMKAGPDVAVPSHDWWLYILVTAVDGAVHYDARPSVRYRVHDGNVIGANCSLRARLSRINRLLRGQLRAWTDMHVAALWPLLPELSPESRHILTRFAQTRKEGLVRRLIHARALRIYRQTRAGNIALRLALLMRKA